MFFRPVLGNPTKSPSFRPNFQSKTGKKNICSCVGHVKSHPIRVAFAPNAGIENKLSLHRRNRFLPGKPPSQAPQPPFPGTEKHGAAEVCLPSAALCRDRWPPAFPDRREHPFFTLPRPCVPPGPPSPWAAPPLPSATHPICENRGPALTAGPLYRFCPLTVCRTPGGAGSNRLPRPVKRSGLVRRRPAIRRRLSPAYRYPPPAGPPPWVGPPCCLMASRALWRMA